ncbi:MAG: hypothetical protein KAS21_11220 [Candidatus Aminicenantes bacterium]|nr:hypothetical protein [Candidatus Aminicenantes bacterium]MCK5005654.1 hypothetical protein [Candidatus Aminicenantes bacterium]
MSGKTIAAILLILIPFLLSSELIKSSKVKKHGKLHFEIKRNIFSPQKTNKFRKGSIASRKAENKKAELMKQSKEAETRVIASVFYEGFLIKESRIFALLKVNGQFYISREGDRIPGNILVKKILEKKIVLEIESSEVSVLKKGERNAN